MADIVVNQFLVAGSFLLTALPLGCSLGYPNVLIQQLRANDSMIQLDMETTTWIGSIYGLASIPSIFMPAFMQWRGRKITFMVVCLLSSIGWITAYAATTSTAILISEMFHGLGSQSIIAVGMLSMSEMLSPQIRSVAMSSYIVIQALGITLVGVMGTYLHWKTISLIVCAPIVIVTVVVAMFWPESPSWLAYKGEFDKCAKAFTRLRGTGDIAQTELTELIMAQKETSRTNDKEISLKSFWKTIKRRDFYLPMLHIFVVFQPMYWAGGLAFMIYPVEIIPRVTSIKDSVPFGSTSFNVSFTISCISCIVLVRYFKPKQILLGSSLGGIALLLTASAINFCQSIGYVSYESYVCLYVLIGYMYVINLCLPIQPLLASELMPVKHKGIGGPLSVIMTSVLHSIFMKIVPYMFKYVTLWGTFLLFTVGVFIPHMYTWKYIPETKGKTLQQIEDFYNFGNMDNRRKIGNETLNELMTVKD